MLMAWASGPCCFWWTILGDHLWKGSLLVWLCLLVLSASACRALARCPSWARIWWADVVKDPKRA